MKKILVYLPFLIQAYAGLVQRSDPVRSILQMEHTLFITVEQPAFTKGANRIYGGYHQGLCFMPRGYYDLIGLSHGSELT